MRYLWPLAFLVSGLAHAEASQTGKTVDVSNTKTFTDSHGTTHGLGFLGRKHRHGVLYWSPATTRDMPTSYDLRTLGWVAPIRDQGSCGSCWAFSITKTLESALLRSSSHTSLDLAEQSLVSCDTNAYGCNGGMMDDMDFVVKHGLPLEKDFPYTASDSRCKEPAVAAKGVRWGYVGGENKEPTMDEIKQALLDYGVLSVVVAAGGNDWSDGGHMTDCDNSGQNHMVNLAGWTEKGELIGANSWGTSWGEKGFFYAKQHCDELATGEGSVSFVVVEGSPATPPQIRLPAEIDILPGTTGVMIGVKPEQGVTYSWTANNSLTSETQSAIEVSPTADTVYKIIAKTPYGTAESSVKVHILPENG